MSRGFHWQCASLAAAIVAVAAAPAAAVEPAALMPREQGIYVEVDLGADNERAVFLRGLVEGILDGAMTGLDAEHAEFAADLVNTIREQMDWLTAGFGPKAAVLVTAEGLERSQRAQRAAIERARATAEAVECQSNLKQLVVAARMFADDWDGVLPRAETWADDLRDYVRDNTIFRCPEAPDLPVGYAMNRALSGRLIAEIENPAETVLFFESGRGGDNPAGGAAAVAPPRHPGGGSFAFVDGHVSVERPPRDFPNFGRWDAAPGAAPPPDPDEAAAELADMIPDFVATIDTRYGAAQLFEKLGLTLEPTETYRGVPLYLPAGDMADLFGPMLSLGFADVMDLQPPKDIALAFTEGRLLVGKAETVKAALDVAAGEGETLADDPAFQRAVAMLPQPRMVTFYEPIDLVIRLMKSEMALKPEDVGWNEAMLGKVMETVLTLYEPFEAVAAAIDFSAEGLVVEDVTTVRAGAESELLDRMAKVPAATEKGAGLLPNDTLLYMTVGGTRDWVRLGLDIAEGISPEIGEWISTGKQAIKQAIGLDLDSMVLPLLGRDSSIAITGVGGMPMPVHGALMIQGPDAAIVKAKVNALRQLLTKKHKMTFLDEEFAGTKYSTMVLPDTPLAIAYAQVGDTLIVASSTDALEDCLLRAGAAPALPLAAAEGYRAHRAALPDEMLSLVYLDLSGAATQAVAMLRMMQAVGAPIPELDLPWEALGTVIGGDYRQDDSWRSTLRWSLQPEIIVAAGAKAAGPAIRAAHERARQTACWRNLREVTAAAREYARDHDGVLPHADHWVQELEPYLEDAEALRCPEAPDFPIAYAMNRALSGVRLADIENPAETVLFFETELRGPSPAGGIDNIARLRHQGGNNFAFVDGHVSLETPPAEFPGFGEWEAPRPELPEEEPGEPEPGAIMW